MNLNIRVTQQLLTASGCAELASQSVNYLTYTMRFSEDWDNLAKIIVFKNGADEVEVLWDESAAVHYVPREVLTTNGGIYISVKGVGNDGRLVITTKKMARPVFVSQCGDYSGNNEQDYTPSLKDQIAAQVARAEAAAKSAAADAASAERTAEQLALRSSIHHRWVGTYLEITSASGTSTSENLVGPAGPQGNPGAVFTPSVDADGNISWSNNGALPNPSTINIRGPQGLRGETGATGATGERGLPGANGSDGAVFTPSVDAAGNISWSNNGGLTNPDPVNIRGPQGETGSQGVPGQRGERGQTGERGEQGYTFTPSVDAAGNISWTNDGGLTNPPPQNIRGPQGLRGERGDTGSGFAVLDYYASLSALQAAVPSPSAGDAYGVGAADPYDIYIYGETSGWVNNGPLQGAKGDKGDKGDPFTYDDFTSEQLANLKGPRGDTGPQGAQGPAGSAGAAGKDGTSVTHSWSGTTLIVSSASGTSSANLKGDKGDDGSAGAAGKDGTSVSIRSITETAVDGGNNIVTFSDGKTMVVKNGSKGSDGSTGPAGPAGNDGAAGKDGVSVTHSWSGTTLTVTSASGTSSANLKGEKGDTGSPGEAGPAGPAGSNGNDGKNATINGVNALTIETDEYISATQSGSVLTIGLKSVPSSSASHTVTLTTGGWSDNGDGRLKQTVSVSGVTASTPVVIVDVALTGTDLDADAAALGAWASADGKGPGSQNITQGNGAVTFYCAAVPSINIPVFVGVA